MAVSFYDNLTNTLEYPHFLKNIKPHESEYLIKHIAVLYWSRHRISVSV